MCEIEKNILKLADKYGIPYDKKNINWYELEDRISDFEILEEEADNLCIDWREYGHDPIGIQQEIEDKQEKQREELILDRLAYYT